MRMDGGLLAVLMKSRHFEAAAGGQTRPESRQDSRSPGRGSRGASPRRTSPSDSRAGVADSASVSPTGSADSREMNRACAGCGAVTGSRASYASRSQSSPRNLTNAITSSLPRAWPLLRRRSRSVSPVFSPRGEGKCVRGPSVRGARRLTTGIQSMTRTWPYGEHGEQAQRTYWRGYRVLRPSGGEKCGLGFQRVRPAGVRVGFWLGGRDSNPDKQIQNLLCYRYTTSQYVGT